MMASNSTLGLSVCRELSQNLRVVCVSPETTHDPKARSRSPRRGVLQDCGAVFCKVGIPQKDHTFHEIIRRCNQKQTNLASGK